MVSVQVDGLRPPEFSHVAEFQIGSDSARRAALPSLTGLRWTAALLVFLYHVSVVQYFGGHPAPLVDWAFSVEPNAKPGPGQLVANLLLLHAWVSKVTFYQSLNTVSWSLSCEALFYVVFPFLIGPLRRIGGRGSSIVVAGCVAAEFLIPRLADHLYAASALNFRLYYFPLARLPEFLLGMALAQVVLAGRWRGPGLAVSLAITTFSYFLTSRVHFEYRYEACTVIGITCLIAAAALADVRGELSPWRSKRAVKLGELSFAFYMIHILVMRVGEHVFRPHPKAGWLLGSAATLAAFAVSFCAAWVLHTYLEKPGRRLILIASK